MGGEETEGVIWEWRKGCNGVRCNYVIYGMELEEDWFFFWVLRFFLYDFWFGGLGF